jgi:hypothetical protein
MAGTRSAKGKTTPRIRKQVSRSDEEGEIEGNGKGKRRKLPSRSEPPKKRGKAWNPSTDLSEAQRLEVYNEMKKKKKAEQNLQVAQEAQGMLFFCPFFCLA